MGKRKKWRKKGRETLMCEIHMDQLPLTHPQLGTWPKTQAYALTGNQTFDLFVHRPALSLLACFFYLLIPFCPGLPPHLLWMVGLHSTLLYISASFPSKFPSSNLKDFHTTQEGVHQESYLAQSLGP